MEGRKGKGSMKRKPGIALITALIITAAVIWAAIGGMAEEQLAKCWVMCKPGSQVNVRRTPDKKGQEVGFLEAGDWFLTDGTSSDGFIRVYGVGEYGEGWIFSGYVCTEEPKQVFEQYTCVAHKRVAIRKWMGGPQVERSPWLANGSNVDVFFMADEWACTSRGYIKSEWLEADPR